MGNKRDRTREIILEASYGLFAKNGFNKITMKDICEATHLSRGGLYSHFSSTKELFEAILNKLNQKEEMNFYAKIDKEVPATEILDFALTLLESEMNRPKDSLSLAMYEYSGSVSSSYMQDFFKQGEEKWTALIKYGITRGEFKSVNVEEIVNIILYVYQGVRMWSCIVEMPPDKVKSITSYIRHQLLH